MAGYQGMFNLDPEDRKNVLPLAMRHLASGWASIVGLLAIVAAVMSSVDSSMLSASSLVAHNIFFCVVRRNKASDIERAVVLRCAVLLLGALATGMALSTNSVFELWTHSSELCYVLLFPQFMALFFLQRYSNAYGAVAGFLVGIAARILCGAPQFGIPVFVRLPLYDDVRGQLFPYRTLCMVVSLVTILVVSALTVFVFDAGLIPPDWDVWNCFGYAEFFSDDHTKMPKPVKSSESARKGVVAYGEGAGFARSTRPFGKTGSATTLGPAEHAEITGNITAGTSATATGPTTPAEVPTPGTGRRKSENLDTQRTEKRGELTASGAVGETAISGTGHTTQSPEPSLAGQSSNSDVRDSCLGNQHMAVSESTALVPLPTSAVAVIPSEITTKTPKPAEEDEQAFPWNTASSHDHSTTITWHNKKTKRRKKRSTSASSTSTTCVEPMTPAMHKENVRPVQIGGSEPRGSEGFIELAVPTEAAPAFNPLRQTEQDETAGSTPAGTSVTTTMAATPVEAPTPRIKRSKRADKKPKGSERGAELTVSGAAGEMTIPGTGHTPPSREPGLAVQNSKTDDRDGGASCIGTKFIEQSASTTGHSSSSAAAVTPSERTPKSAVPAEEEEQAFPWNTTSSYEHSTSIAWLDAKRENRKKRRVSALTADTTSVEPTTPLRRMSMQGMPPAEHKENARRAGVASSESKGSGSSVRSITPTGAGSMTPTTPRSVPGTPGGAGKRKRKGKASMGETVEPDSSKERARRKPTEGIIASSQVVERKPSDITPKDGTLGHK